MPPSHVPALPTLTPKIGVVDEVAANDAFAVRVTRIRLDVAIRPLEVLLDGVRVLVVDLEAEPVAGHEIAKRGNRVDGMRGLRKCRDQSERGREATKDPSKHDGARFQYVCPRKS